MNDASLPLQRVHVDAIRDRLRSLQEKLSRVRTREDLRAGARHLGIQNTFMFGSTSDMTLLFDYVHYSHRPRGFNLGELYLRTHGDRLDDFARSLLARMSAAVYTIFTVESIAADSVLAIQDRLLERPFQLLDRGLSRTAEAGMTLACHLLVFDDFTLTTGAGFPVDGRLLQSDARIVELVQGLQDNRGSRTDPALRAKLARRVIAACLRLGYTQRVHYE
jgi:hypothetical protein